MARISTVTAQNSHRISKQTGWDAATKSIQPADGKRGGVDLIVARFLSAAKEQCGTLSCFRIPDLEIIEEAVLTHAAKFHFRLRRVCNAWGLQKGHCFAIDRGPHRVAYGL